jgi:putative translation initiation factor eIF-6
MYLKKATIYKSPFLGVYSYCSDDFCIVPKTILNKEYKILNKYLDTKIITTQINDSSLIGVYLTGNKNKLIVQKESIKSNELELLEKEGIKVKLIEDYNAVGNLFSINSNYGIVSPLIKKENVKLVSKFLNIDLEQKTFCNLDVPGSSLYVNDHLFLVNPNIKKKEYDKLQKNFKVIGTPTTLNYGDVFVGNDIIANKNVIFVGSTTSNIEIRKVDDVVLEL